MFRTGCYRIVCTNAGALGAARYEGTLRVAPDGSVSGDLYDSSTAPDPKRGIPIFPRANYRHHLVKGQVTPANPDDKMKIDLTLRTYVAGGSFKDGVAVSARMTRAPGAADLPSPNDCWNGALVDSADRKLCDLEFVRVSDFLRKSVIEIGAVAGCEKPTKSGSNAGAQTWIEVLKRAGWETEIREGDVIPNGTNSIWNAGELHFAMLDHRARSANLDTEWRFFLLCVERIVIDPDRGDDWGFMYDSGTDDSNHLPREGFAVAASWRIPQWMKGRPLGTRFGEYTEAYFRTALHEAGHAMGLQHDVARAPGLMDTSHTAADATPGAFPSNIVWDYVDKDLETLRHASDMEVRPGGTIGTGYMADMEDPELAPDLELLATPRDPSFPIGAPVRIELRLRNRGAAACKVPPRWGLGSGLMRGFVTGPDGEKSFRSFRPILRSCAKNEPVDLAPQETRTESVTLLRGKEKALFPKPGAYDVKIRVEWKEPGAAKALGVIAKVRVQVTPAENDAHRDLANKILNEPGVLTAWAIGGDASKEGVEAITKATECSVLGPHFRYAEARRLATRCRKREADLGAAANVLLGKNGEKQVVLSRSEIKRAEEIANCPKEKDREGACARLRDLLAEMAKGAGA